MDWVLRERVTRRRFLKIAGGTVLMTVADLQLPGRAEAAMTRMRWVERDVFPPGGLYQSPAFTADQRFNSVEASWLADEPPGSELRFAVRLSEDGKHWSDWIQLHRDSHVGSLAEERAYCAPVLTSGMRHVQYRVEIVPNNAGQVPVLQEVEIGGVDTTPGARLLAMSEPALIDGWIIPRHAWGADESLRFKDGEEIWPPEHEPIKKVIVHHTVTQNHATDPAASVRAIYSYHAVTKGWGDIGYNFLIDWDGRVYEGRYGDANVVAGHALQYNYGSMGIALLGTFSTVDPPKAMLDSLVRLIKSRAGHLDPGDMSFFIDRANVANICGHRDVLATECPGDHGYEQVPIIRGACKATDPIYIGSWRGESTDAEIVSMTIKPTEISAGATIKVTAVVRNTGENMIYTQGPASLTYNEDQNYDEVGYPKLKGLYRFGVDFEGNQGTANPFRWGFPKPLEPGEETTVTGSIRLSMPGEWTFTGSVVQEWVAYRQQDVFPTVVRVKGPPTEPALRSDDPSLHYFEITRHNVPDVFYQYWLANGGLRMFGYPLTEPFEEKSITDGAIYRTQYFERARFEHHPEHAGTPHEVLLGLLGRERTRGREKEPAFKPVKSDGTENEHRRFFPETGHWLAYGFLSYWTDHGGLPVFGYPISEEFQERSKTDGETYTVQYFERARFEWHPEFRGTEHEVLLGHLAREMLIDRGWLPSEA